MITYITDLRIPERNAEEFAAIIAEMIAKVAQHEPGVIHYGFGRSEADPERWTVVEVYRDESALTAHWQTDYIRPLLARTTPLVEGEIDSRRYDAP